MYPTNNLKPIVRYTLGILAGLLSAVLFLLLTLGALKLGEIILSIWRQGT